MTKKARKTGKRTLALFMTVLMLMSAWVFVAPTMAEAATAGTYDVRFYIYDSEGYGGKKSITLTAKYKADNGTGTETSESTIFSYSENSSILTSGGVSNGLSSVKTNVGFPSYIYYYSKTVNLRYPHLYVRVDVKGHGAADSQYKTLIDLKFHDKGFMSSNEASGTKTIDDFENVPYAATVSWANTTGKSITVPLNGTATATTSTATIYDQYGVTWYEAPSYAFKGGSDQTTTTCDTISGITRTTGKADSCTLTVTNSARTWVSNSQDGTTYQRTVYLTAYYSDSVKTTSTYPVTITNCKYTQSYNGNGITINSNSFPTSYDFYYGLHPNGQKTADSKSSTAEIYPQNLTRIGYKFKGMYSSANTKYDLAEANATFSGTKLTDTQKVTTTNTWYAAWWAKNVTVTFKNNDGSNWGNSVTGKYDKKSSDSSNTYYNVPQTTPTVVTDDVYNGSTYVTYDHTNHWEFDKWVVYSATQYSNAANDTQSDYPAIVGQTPDQATLLGDTVFIAQYKEVAHDYNGAVVSHNDGTHSWMCTKGCGTYGTPSGGKNATTSCDDTMVWHDLAAATCGHNGYQTGTCSVCSYTTQRSTPALVHSFTGAVRSRGADGHDWPCVNGCGTYGTPNGVNTVAAHNFGNWITDTAATCTSTGTKHRICSVCNYREDGTIPMASHSGTHHAETAATCQAAGNIEYWQCATCHKYFSNSTYTTEITTGVTIAQKAHSYTGAYVNNNDGTHSRRCINGCNQPGDTQNCAFSDWATDAEASCTGGGTEIRTCQYCGYGESRNTGAQGHSLTRYTEATPATCVNTGLIETWYCSRCNKYFADYNATQVISNINTGKIAPIDSTNHASAVRWVAEVPATCTAAGTAGYYTCDSCQGKFSDAAGTVTVTPATIPSHGHNYIWSSATYGWNATHTTCTATAVCSYDQTHKDYLTVSVSPVTVDATCTSAGATTYTADFGGQHNLENQTYQVILPATGHNMDGSNVAYNWTQSGDTWTCTATETCANSGCTHTETRTGVVTKGATTATCTAAGTITYTATFPNTEVPDTTKTVSDSALGHDMTTVYAKAATCTAAGNNQYYVCERCGNVYKDANGNTATTVAAETIGMIDHDFHGAITSNGDGTHDVACSYGCGTTTTVDCDYRQSVATQDYLKQAATCTTAHQYYLSCDCGESSQGSDAKHTNEYFEIGDALGHNLTDWAATTPATCTTAGEEERHCQRTGCDYSETRTVAAFGHNWNDWAVQTPATCTATGVETRTCKNDSSHTETRPIPKTDHTWIEVVDATYLKSAATCASPAVYYKSCSVCHAASPVETFTDGGVDSSNHTALVMKWISAPTCTTDGEYVQYCTACQQNIGDVQTMPAGHHYNQGIETTHPTCSTPGVKTFTCGVCDDTFTVPVPKTAHTYGDPVNHAATCTTPAWSEKTCTACGDHVVTYTGTAANGHTFVPDTDHNANGVDGGRLYLKCSVCGATLNYALPVTADEIQLVSVNPATCKVKGSVTIQYKINGNSAWQETTLELPVDANAHSYAMDKVDPTCTTAGYYQLKCSLCDATTGRVDVAALGHHYVQDGADPTITCTTTGNRTYKCDRCNDSSVSFTVPLGYKQHNYSVLVGSHHAATCTQNGYDTYQCPNCQTTIDKIDLNDPATGHSYPPSAWTFTSTQATAVCATCQAESSRITIDLPADASSYTATAVITQKATCQADGIIRVTITGTDKDGNPITPIPVDVPYTDADAHDYQTVYSAPGCETGGSYKTECALCHAVKTGSTTVTLDALGHNWETVTAATCAAAGSEKCSRCNATQEIPKLQHSYGEGVEDPATCTAAGSVTFTCSACAEGTPGHTLTFPTSTTPHTYNFTAAPASTTQGNCSTTQSTATYNCTKCGGAPVTINTGLAQHQYNTAAITIVGKRVTIPCANCSAKIEFDLAADPNASIDVDYLNLTPPTCAADGTLSVTYTVYGTQYTETFDKTTIPALAQTTTHPAASISLNYQPATCTATGSVVAHCSLCNSDISAATTIAKLPHTYNLTTPNSTVPGTCQTDGSQTFRCTVCSTEASDVTVNTGRGGHNFQAGTPVAATCTTPGYTPYTCSVDGCNESYNKYETTGAPLGHNWDTAHAAYNDDGTKLIVSCLRADCNETLTVDIPAFANITSVQITQQPTCNATGLATVAYTENGQQKTVEGVEIAKNLSAHAGLTTTITTEPGCESTGTVTTQCTACNTEIGTVTIPAKGHNWDFPGTITTPATCQDAEVRTIACSNCDATRTITGSTVAHSYTVEQPALEHAADCTSMAYKVYKCQWCDATTKVFDEAQPATDHTYVFQSVSHGTVTVKCSNINCNKVLTFSLGENYSSGHNFTTFTVETYPTCTTAGKGILSCSNGDGATIEVNIPVDSSKSIHKNFTRQIQAATCAAAGYDKTVCADCGTLISEVTLPQLNHIYNVPGVETTPATCTTAGERTFTCSLCQGTVTTPIPATNHHYVAGETHAATCMKPAYTTYTCNNPNCTDSYDKYDTTTYAAAHNYTWTYDHGVAIGTCQTCNATVPGHEIRFNLGNDANGHTYEAAVTPATCTEVGSVVFTCTDADCDKSISVELPIDSMHHTALVAQHLDPTCTTTGYDKVVCTDCNTVITSVTLNTVDHQYLKANATVTAATCTMTGTRSYKCTWCNSTVDETIPMLQHNFVAGTPVAATCTTPAYTPYHCSTCSAAYNAYDPASVANGHSLSITGVSHGVATLACANCNYTVSMNLNNDDAYDAGHNYSILSEVVPATCQAPGSAKLFCSDEGCNAYLDVVIPVNSNAHAYTYSKTDPTCTGDGSVVCTCSNEGCNYSATVATFNAKGHTFTQDEGYYTRNDATCTAEGSITYRCKDCEATMTETLPKVLHVFQVDETVPATCLNSAYKVMKCENCDETYNEYVPSETAVPHSYTWTFERTAEYYRAKGVCSVCGDLIFTDSIPLEATYHYTVAITTDPTCHEAGAATITCTEDGSTFNVTIPALPGHHTTNKISTVYNAPTCLGTGSIVTTCTACNTEISRETVPAVGHQYTSAVTIEPTCIAEGVRTYTCPNCDTETTGHSYTEAIAKVQHVFEKTGSTAATCLTQPYDTYTCTQDGCTESYIVTTGNAFGHSLVKDRVENGILYLKCNRCDYTTNFVVGTTSGYTYDTFTVTVKPTCNTNGTGELTDSSLGAESPIIHVTIPQDPSYHSNVNTVYTPATCQSAGSVISTCQGCGAVLSTKSITKLQHHWVETEDSYTAPTCTESGLVKHTYVCDNPGCIDPETTAAATLVVSDTLPAKGHSWYKVSPTCTEDGYINCAVCGATMDKAGVLADDTLKMKFAPNGTELDPIGHSYGAWYSVSDTKHERMCVHGCGVTEQVAHAYNDGVVTTPATCTGKGVTLYTCADCGHAYTQTISALGHDFTPKTDGSNVQVIEATCETPEYTITTCTREGCDAQHWAQTAAANGHEWGTPVYSISMDGDMCVFTATAVCAHNSEHQQFEIQRKAGTIDPAATCETDGLITYTCTFTNSLFNQPQTHTIEIPATGHNLTIHVEGVEPTCTEPGNVEYWQCTNDGCGKYFSDANAEHEITSSIVIPATDHDFSGAARDNNDDTHSFLCANGCGAYGAVIDGVQTVDGKVAHEYGEWVVTIEPTCEEPGERQRVCEVCGNIQTDVNALAPHTLYGTSAKSATCTKAGNIAYYYCPICRKYFTDDTGTTETTLAEVTIPASGHNFTGAIRDNGDGTHSFKCSRCSEYGAVIEETNKTYAEGGKLGHTFDQQVETRAYLRSYANCEKPMSYYYSCTCGAKGENFFEKGEALGHTMIDYPGQAATCTSAGHTPYKQCSRCPYREGYEVLNATGHGAYYYDEAKSGSLSNGTMRWEAYACENGCGDYYMKKVTIVSLDANGNRVPNVNVSVINSAGRTILSGTTNNNGEIVFEGENSSNSLHPGTYTIYLEYVKDGSNYNTHGTVTIGKDGKASGSFGTLTPYGGNASGSIGGQPTGEFRCSMCDTYDSMKDKPVIGWFISIIHAFVHAISRLGK